jgi:hypothetical protein
VNPVVAAAFALVRALAPLHPMVGVVLAVLEALEPTAEQIVTRALAHDPDPFAGVLHADVAATIPVPLRARIALEAAKARAAQA